MNIALPITIRSWIVAVAGLASGGLAALLLSGTGS